MPTLYYIMDPMCSWCWGFRPIMEALERQLPGDVHLRYVMGGLAPDSDEPMPEQTREYIRQAWRTVAARTGAHFNFAFWEQCEPRRSTWPACRAVIAAATQDPAKRRPMVHAIQEAYYLEARNPADRQTLVDIAGKLGLDAERFAADLDSAAVNEALHADLLIARRFGIQGFPSLVLEDGERAFLVSQGYMELNAVIGRLRNALAAAGTAENTGR